MRTKRKGKKAKKGSVKKALTPRYKKGGKCKSKK